MPRNVRELVESDWLTKVLLTLFIGLMTWNLKTTYDLALVVSTMQAKEKAVSSEVSRRLESIEDRLDF